MAELVEALGKQHVTKRTLYRARKEAGVESELETTPTGTRAVWRLASNPAAPADPGRDEANYLRQLLDKPG